MSNSLGARQAVSLLVRQLDGGILLQHREPESRRVKESTKRREKRRIRHQNLGDQVKKKDGKC